MLDFFEEMLIAFVAGFVFAALADFVKGINRRRKAESRRDAALKGQA